MNIGIPVRSGVRPRDLEILPHLCEGLSDKEIGRRIGMSWTTVKARVRRMIREFGVEGRVGLAVHAATRGWV